MLDASVIARRLAAAVPLLAAAVAMVLLRGAGATSLEPAPTSGPGDIETAVFALG